MSLMGFSNNTSSWTQISVD